MSELIPYFKYLGGVSLFTFLLSLFLVPWYIGRLPEDHFIRFHTAQPRRIRSPFGVTMFILRNLIGLFLFIAGFVMLFLPGQGILTMLIGIICMSFPGRQRLLLYLIAHKSIQKSFDWVRLKLSRPPFRWM